MTRDCVRAVGVAVHRAVQREDVSWYHSYCSILPLAATLCKRSAMPGALYWELCSPLCTPPSPRSLLWPPAVQLTNSIPATPMKLYWQCWQHVVTSHCGSSATAVTCSYRTLGYRAQLC